MYNSSKIKANKSEERNICIKSTDKTTREKHYIEEANCYYDKAKDGNASVYRCSGFDLTERFNNRKLFNYSEAKNVVNALNLEFGEEYSFSAFSPAR